MTDGNGPGWGAADRAAATEAGEWLSGLMLDAETDRDAMRSRMMGYVLELSR